jgi:CBS domain-containing protein
MRVKDLMTPDPMTCAPDLSVAAAANLMWEGDCGILPIVEGGKLIGVVTDRDMYIALATRNTRASELPVAAVAHGPVVTCAPEDDVHAALAIMKQARVRRLPVVGFGDAVLGVLSIDDVVRAAGQYQGPGSEEIVDTLRVICSRHHPAPHVIAA